MRILAATGASGGHIFPAVSLLERLKDSRTDIDVLLVLPQRNIKNKITPEGFRIRYISVCPITLKLNLKFFLGLINLLKGSFESLFLLAEFRPDIVVGFGCIETIPIMFFAWLFRIKTLIHEQNVIPGKANRLLAVFADKIALSFPDSKKYFKDFRKKIVFTGNPIRIGLEKIERKEALNFFGFKEDKFTILVVGGSLGSHRINEAFLKGLPGIADKAKLQVIHLSGFQDYEFVNNGYKEMGVEVKVLDFFKAMHYAYSASDLVISRAGATTITEIMFFGLAAILIPYPYAYRHQFANAEVLEKKGCAFVIGDDELEGQALSEKIQLLLNNPKKIQAMRSGYVEASSNNASNLLAGEVISLNN